MEILQDFIILTKKGLYCPYGNFYIDPTYPVLTAVVSHAHADHAVRGNHHVFCTQATMLFMQERYKKHAASHFYIKGYQESFDINGIKISLYPAGHILGSAMVLMEYKQVKYLYTGDYKLETDATCEAAILTPAHVLITETTFANPTTAHPNAIEEIKKLNTIKTNVMLGAYALGKSQRLIHLINRYCPQKNIVIHHGMVPFTNIYTQLGVNLGAYQIYDRKIFKRELENHVYIVPPLVFNGYNKPINMVKAFVSGWEYLQQHNELKIFISDHVDWQAIIETIEKVQPREVWTLHGDGKLLKDHYKDQLTVKILN